MIEHEVMFNRYYYNPYTQRKIYIGEKAHRKLVVNGFIKEDYDDNGKIMIFETGKKYTGHKNLKLKPKKEHIP